MATGKIAGTVTMAQAAQQLRLANDHFSRAEKALVTVPVLVLLVLVAPVHAQGAFLQPRTYFSSQLIMGTPNIACRTGSPMAT
jgi:hypothetical protein